MTAAIDDQLIAPRHRPSIRLGRFRRPTGATLDEGQLDAVRRQLESLIHTFETDRCDQIVEGGVALTAAYDAGIRDAVHEALDELDAGCYGRCIVCDDQIPFTRLIETPFARRCATCQQREQDCWNEVERSFAAVIRQWVGEPQGSAAATHRHPRP